MGKVLFIDEDERWPFYFVYKSARIYDYMIEVTDEEYEFIVKAMEDFEKAQELIKRKIDQQE